MNEAEFRKWMVDQGHSLATQNTQAQDAKRLEAHYGDLDEAFDADGLEGIKAELAYSKADERAGKKNPARFPIDGNLYANLSHYRSTLNYYIQFRSGTAVSGYDSLEADKRIALFDDAGTAHWPVRQTNRQSGVKAFRIMGSSNRTEDAIETDDILAVARALFKEQRLVRVLRSNNGRRPYLGYGKQKLTSYEIDAEIAAALGIPAKGSIHGNDLILDHAELAKLKARFLRTYPDFEPHGFAGSTSRVFDDVINYKRDAVAKVAALIQSEPPLALEALGAALFDILTGIDLPGWRTNNRLAAIRKQHPNVLEHAAAELARSISDPPAAAHRMVEAIWPVLVEGQDKSKPYSESRNIPSMFLALVRPRDALGINTDPLSQAYKALVRKPLFGWNPLTANEYAEALRFANTLFDEMVSWGWQPRDLWDVQSFLWVVKQEDQAADAIPTSSEMRPSMPSATNLILYGPPGTGKTYATAAEALEICNGPGSAPLERKELMEVYQSLHRKGRIGFVTFHQSFSYEEFVEGLRPVTGEESDDGPATGGFSLKPHDGIFKQIANLAAENRGHAVAVENSLLDRTQKIFKMSLGRSWAAEDDAIFQDAIRDGYIVLGYGGEVDWSDPRFDKWEAIKERWREDHPAATGNDPNMSQMYELPALRGRLDVERQFTRLAASPQRLACRFEELSSDTPLNQIMKAAVSRLMRVSQNAENQRRLAELGFAYADITNIPVTGLRWDDVHIDRTNSRWRELVTLAKLLLGERFQTSSMGRQDGFSLLFEMNTLFEEYIGRMLRRALAGTGYSVSLQGGRLFCLENETDGRRVFQTRPDILVKRGNEVVQIIDTKWKRISSQIDDPKRGVSQADVYQMMAYGQIYDCNCLSLLYPHHAALADSPGALASHRIGSDQARLHTTSIELGSGQAVFQQLRQLTLGLAEAEMC